MCVCVSENASGCEFVSVYDKEERTTVKTETKFMSLFACMREREKV